MKDKDKVERVQCYWNAGCVFAELDRRLSYRAMTIVFVVTTVERPFQYMAGGEEMSLNGDDDEERRGFSALRYDSPRR